MIKHGNPDGFYVVRGSATSERIVVVVGDAVALKQADGRSVPGIDFEDDFILVEPSQLDGLIAALQKAKQLLSVGHAASGEPESACDNSAHETPGRQEQPLSVRHGAQGEPATGLPLPLETPAGKSVLLNRLIICAQDVLFHRREVGEDDSFLFEELDKAVKAVEEAR